MWITFFFEFSGRTGKHIFTGNFVIFLLFLYNRWLECCIKITKISQNCRHKLVTCRLKKLNKKLGSRTQSLHRIQHTHVMCGRNYTFRNTHDENGAGNVPEHCVESDVCSVCSNCFHRWRHSCTDYCATDSDRMTSLQQFFSLQGKSSIWITKPNPSLIFLNFSCNIRKGY
jgi:hypothetical protein